jgi:hypothetical protein
MIGRSGGKNGPPFTTQTGNTGHLDYFPSGRLSLTLTDPHKSRWNSGHLLGRWHDRKAKNLESYLNAIMVATLTGAAIVRHNRIAAEAAERKRQ